VFGRRGPTGETFLRSHIPIYDMASTIRVSDEFREFVKAHNRDDETMEETLRRLIGGPDPTDVVGFLSAETATVIEEHVEATGAADLKSRRRIVERMDDP